MLSLMENRGQTNRISTLTQAIRPRCCLYTTAIAAYSCQTFPSVPRIFAKSQLVTMAQIHPQNYPFPWTDRQTQLPASSLDPSDLPSLRIHIRSAVFPQCTGQTLSDRQTNRWLAGLVYNYRSLTLYKERHGLTTLQLWLISGRCKATYLLLALSCFPSPYFYPTSSQYAPFCTPAVPPSPDSKSREVSSSSMSGRNHRIAKQWDLSFCSGRTN